MADIVRETRQEATFEHLVKFVESESAVANTLAGQLCISTKREEKQRGSNHRPRKGVTCAALASKELKSLSCYYCSEDHLLSKCEEFGELNNYKSVRIS